MTYSTIDRVNVTKDFLLGKLRANRDIHLEEYKLAVAEYLKAASLALDDRLKDVTGFISTGIDVLPKDFSANVDIHSPRNHLADYDRVIEMLEASTANEVSLSSREFSRYVKNEWDWVDEFASDLAGYAMSNARIAGKRGG